MTIANKFHSVLQMSVWQSFLGDKSIFFPFEIKLMLYMFIVLYNISFYIYHSFHDGLSGNIQKYCMANIR